MAAVASIGVEEVLALVPQVPQLLGDLRSDHAGEVGAVMIYRGVLAVARDPDLRRFAAQHLATEQGHLALMEVLVAASQRSRLLPAWKIAGFLTGFLPALMGSRIVYATIEAVESFVDRHYAEQIRKLAPTGTAGALRSILVACRQDELHHRDEARAAQFKPAGRVVRMWAAMVGFGSRAAVAAARRI